MLLDRIEKWYDRTGKKIVYSIYLLLGVVGIYLFFKYILELVLPFIVAWILASLLNPVVTFLKRRAKVPRGIGTLLSMLTILTGISTALTLLIRQLWIQIVEFTTHFNSYRIQIETFLENIQIQLQSFMDRLPLPEAFQSLDDVISTLLEHIGGFLTRLVSGTYDAVSKVPNGLFFIVVMLIATFFMTKDYQKIKGFVRAQMPPKFLAKVGLMKEGLKNALGGYVKTQLILMCFTFTICMIGLFVLQRPYVFLIALGIAVFDAFPMFGSGAILIPWGIYHLISGNYALGIGLLAIYGLIIVMRQVMEPKVLSTQIGVYALVTLMSMYIGFKVLGVLGLILGPVTMVMIKTLQTIGIIPPFKQSQEEVQIKKKVRR